MGRWWIVVLGLAGCGPQVVVPEDDGSSGGDGTSTSGVSVGSTRADDTAPPMTTAMPPSPSTTVSDDGPSTSTTAGDDTTDDGSDGDSGDMCTCEGMPAELRTVLDEGFTAADVLEHVASTSRPWTWSAIDGDPETTVQIDVVYEGGPITDEIGGCCGIFLCAPCPYGVTIEAFVRITSADGLLDEYVPATVTGTLQPKEFGSEDLHLVSAQIPLANLQGTLPSQAFVDRNGRVIVDTIELVQVWQWNGEALDEPLARLVGYPPAVILGESPMP